MLSAARKDSTPEQRVAHAGAMIDRIIGLIGPVITIHETNRIIAFSNRLSKQIPRSYATHAFRDVQVALIHAEMARLTPVWDKPMWSRNSLQTVFWLAADQEFRAVCDARVWNDHWHQRKQERSWRRLDALAPRAFSATVFERIENFRHKHLAHSLIETRRERAGPVPKPTYADLRRLLMRTIVITSLLHLVVRQGSYDWRGTFRIARRNAEALWNGCTFQVLE